jgi:flagellar motor protein MotB
MGDRQPLAKDVTKRAREQNNRIEIRRVFRK